VEIAGVELSAATAAELVVALERAGYTQLAQRIGIAVDRDVGRVTLLPGDRLRIVNALRDTPGELGEFRGVLLR
jgi:hypothetical protein